MPGASSLVLDLGELAVARAEDLLPGHGHRPAGGRQPEQVEPAGVGARHGPAAGHELPVRDHHIGGEPQVGKRAADQGTRDGLLANLAALIDDTTTKLAFGEMIAASYLEGRGPFQERLPLSGLMWRFLWEYHVTVLRWARWARDQVQAWPQDLSQLDATAEFGRIVATATSPQARW